MVIVNPEASRAIVEERADKVVITVPVKRNWFIFLFLGIWLCGWLAGEVAALGTLLGGSVLFLSKSEEFGPGAIPGGLFLLVWLSLWTVGGVFAITAWVYQWKGQEIIVRDGRFLSHTRDFVFYKRVKEYLNEHVKSVRISMGAGSIFAMMSPEKAMEFWGVGGGTISFDYGAKTIRIGSGLDEAEAKPLVSLLEKYGG